MESCVAQTFFSFRFVYLIEGKGNFFNSLFVQMNIAFFFLSKSPIFYIYKEK